MQQGHSGELREGGGRREALLVQAAWEGLWREQERLVSVLSLLLRDTESAHLSELSQTEHTHRTETQIRHPGSAPCVLSSHDTSPKGQPPA